LTFLWALVLLGVLIFVHELGHFIFAKLLGVKVLKFSMGFGPRIMGFKSKETEYIISALPFGGYVKMLGEEPGEMLTEEEKAISFSGQRIWKRALIAVAGPSFNVLLAYVIFVLFLSIGLPVNIPKLENITPKIGMVLPGSPAERAGIKPGDEVVEIDGRPVVTWFDLISVVSEKSGKPLNIKVKRDSTIVSMTVTPESVKEKTPEGQVITIGRIGVQKAGNGMPFHSITAQNPATALFRGIEATYRWCWFIGDTIVQLLSGAFSAKTVGGPIAIVQESGRAAALGILSYLMFMAIISANLAILNLLPIPILDGGHLLFLGIEAVRGKPLSEQTQGMLQRIGLAILLGIMIFALQNDIMRLIRGG
jgi:regulator of sigma E protease